MPVSGYAIRMLWQDATQGISETYYWNNASSDPVNVVYPAAKQLMKLRTALMGYGVVAKTFRISLLGQFRAYLNSQPQDVNSMTVGPAVLSINTGVPGLPPGVPSTVDGSSAEANETVLVSSYSTIQNHARKFFAGVPSVMVRTSPNGPFVVGVSSWESLFNNYAQYLYSNPTWCFKARVPTSAGGNYTPIGIVSPFYRLDPNNDGTFDVLVPLPSPTVFVPGAKFQIRGCGMSSRAYVNPNGSYTIGTVTNGPISGQYWVQALKSQAWAAQQVVTWGNVRYVDYQLYPYTSTYPTGQGTHKRGNRSLASPGKRRLVPRVSS
jgi:hypothetical protein